MLGTNVLVDLAINSDLVDDDVLDMLTDYSNILCVSMESVRELIIAYRFKKLLPKIWKTIDMMMRSVTEEKNIQVLPVDLNVMRTYSRLELNVAQDHRDPSDPVIISHAITLGIPLISSDRKFVFYQSQGLDLIETENNLRTSIINKCRCYYRL